MKTDLELIQEIKSNTNTTANLLELTKRHTPIFKRNVEKVLYVKPLLLQEVLDDQLLITYNCVKHYNITSPVKFSSYLGSAAFYTAKTVYNLKANRQKYEYIDAPCPFTGNKIDLEDNSPITSDIIPELLNTITIPEHKFIATEYLINNKTFKEIGISLNQSRQAIQQKFKYHIVPKIKLFLYREKIL